GGRGAPRRDLFDDPVGLVALVERRDGGWPFAAGTGGAQDLAATVRVRRDRVVGERQDLGGRAVVLLQSHHRGIRKILLEVQNVPDVGTAPAIDALVVVADDGDVAMTP